MAKVSMKSEKITPFGGIFHVREHFSRFVGQVIDKVLGLRCTSFGYQYSEIVGSLSSVYFCGGDCVVEQDYTFKFLLVYLPCGYSHLIEPLGLKITNQTCSLRNHLLPIIYLLGSSSLHFYLQLPRKKLAVKE